MTISRWKVMACILGLSVGGLAICAGQSNDKLSPPSSPPAPMSQPTEPASIVVPASSKPALPPTALDTLPPIVAPSAPARDLAIDFPALTSVKIPDGGTVISGGLKPFVVTAQADTAPEALPMPRERARRTIPIGDLHIGVAVPIQGDLFPAPEPPVLAAEKAFAPPPPISPPDPLVRKPFDPPSVISAPPIPIRAEPVKPSPPPIPTSPVAPLAPPIYTPDPAPAPASLPPAPPTQASKLKMLLRLGDGTPRFEIRSTDGAALLLKVFGERVEMQSAPEGPKSSPIAGVTASGKVRFVGPGIEGNCDQLSVLSGTGEVLLKGNIHMKSKRGKAWSEMTAEKMIYQIGASGPPNTTSLPRVKPANYTTSP